MLNNPLKGYGAEESLFLSLISWGGFFVVGWALLDSHVGIKHAVFAKEN